MLTPAGRMLDLYRWAMVSPRTEGRRLVDVRHQHMQSGVRRAFTLMETLIASAILFAGVLAVISAIMAGQRKSFEAERQIAATLAAEELMGQYVQMDYADLDGLPSLQAIGEMFALTTVTPFEEDLPGLNVRVHGRSVRIEVRQNASDLRPLAELTHVIPEPQP
jgi:hypothetical protein